MVLAEKRARHSSRPRAARAARGRGVRGEVENGPAERIEVAGPGDETAGDVVLADFGGAINIVRDRGHAAEQSLRNGSWKALAVAGVGQDVHGADVSRDERGGKKAGERQLRRGS
jgi:hypothetical protein